MTPMAYCPTRDQWQARPPAELGLAPDSLAAAIDYHVAHETTWRRDFLTGSGRYIGVADEPPAPDAVLGPVKPRQGPNGLVLRHGFIAAEWGDTARPDMTFSVAKSYLAVLAGLAADAGLIRDVDDSVYAYGLDDGFDSPQNRPITWRHLLQQTSEWQGTLWGKPDSIDHNRDVGQSELGGAVKGRQRALRPPGSHWEYNDVRVNRLSLSLLRLFRRPLAAVLQDAVMGPIGASDTWQWQPYGNSWADVGGVRMPSVPGGSHWGGGLWIGSRDQARLGLLMLRRGDWQGQKLLSGSWIDEMRRPCPANSRYGMLWWLNPGGIPMPFAPPSCYAARGAGSNVIWIDPEHDLVVVARWIDKPHVEPFLRLVVESLKG
jgi:CubicO group peptidase (beta-lactamase class C family)